MNRCCIAVLAALPVIAMPAWADGSDTRQLVELPPMMREHMLGNMRDHLLTVAEIQQALAAGAFDEAAEIAETRLGMSSLTAHGASHMAPYMPKEMQQIGTEMHHAASRFAVVAQDGAVDGALQPAIDALSKITRQCVACHAAFRTH